MKRQLCTGFATENGFPSHSKVTRQSHHKIEEETTDLDSKHCYECIRSKNGELKNLFEHMGKDRIEKCLEWKDKFGSSLLHLAVMFSNISAIEELIRQGADLDAENKYNRTPLFCAHHLEIVKLLIDNGAKIDHKDSQGNTLLYCAFVSSDIELARFLLEKGADFMSVKQQGCLRLDCSEKEFFNMMIYGVMDPSCL